MRVAIVGSRGFRNLERVRAYVRSLPPETVVVSGGAVGVDRAAEAEARACGLGVDSWTPRWRKWGKGAAFIRNMAIARNCERMVAFWDGESRGTRHAMECAAKLGKPVQIVLDSNPD